MEQPVDAEYEKYLKASGTAQVAALATITTDISYIKGDVKEIKEKMEHNYVTQDQLQLFKDQLELIKKLVYGTVSLVLVGFVTALIKK